MKNNSETIAIRTNRSRFIAGLLAIFFGDLGLHKFYLGKATWGLAYLFFSWTFIPMFLGFFEGLYYLLMSDQEFHKKYS
jgi:TM2 domain-containing membrane protein YozV